MSPRQKDRGVEPASQEIILTGEELPTNTPGHILDATGRPAAPEDDLAGD